METPPASLKLSEPDPTSLFTPTDSGTEKPAAMTLPVPEAEEELLPFGKAAKAIFVKANGLAAYYKSTGSFR